MRQHLLQRCGSTCLHCCRRPGDFGGRAGWGCVLAGLGVGVGESDGGGPLQGLAGAGRRPHPEGETTETRETAGALGAWGQLPSRCGAPLADRREGATPAWARGLAPWPAAHLEELHPDAGEDELQERGDQDDVADGANGHEHALHHVLWGRREGARSQCPTLAFPATGTPGHQPLWAQLAAQPHPHHRRQAEPELGPAAPSSFAPGAMWGLSPSALWLC